METKKCKQCFTDIPKKAKRCPRCQADQRAWLNRHPIITIILVFVFIIVLSVSKASNNVEEAKKNSVTSPSTSTESDLVMIGEDGYIRNGQNEVIVTTSKEALSAFTKAAVAKDDVGMMQLVTSKQAFFVKAGTKARVIDSPSLGVKQVRILEGTFAGEAVFIPREFIKKQ